jgi:alpha-L-rhamnosidase
MSFRIAEHRIALISGSFLCFLLAAAQPPVNPVLLKERWPASWIAAAGTPPFDYGVYHFRKTFDLPSRPASFRIHVSADNRYRLFVNGQFVAAGPAQNDLRNWRFETVDLAPYLKPGRNVLAAVVWHGSEFRPMAQISHRAGFILQGDTDAEKAVNTNREWKGIRNPAYSPIVWRDIDPRLMNQYYVAGETERVDGARFPWGWEQPGFDDSAWAATEPITPGAPYGVESHQKWQLVPSPVPLLEETPQRFARVARSEGPVSPASFVGGNAAFTIPPRSRTTFLLDQGALTTGYPVVVASGGRGARIRATYSEALYGANREKGDRNQIEGKKATGAWDEFLPDGGPKRQFRPLWVRSWRYVEMEVETGDDALTIDDVRSDLCRYPAGRKARFISDCPVLQQIWDAGWRTLELGAQDVLVSDLYWERIQYVGDAKLQALAWMAATGDEKLYRQALEQIDASRAPFGLTQSRYPADLEQYTPLYSLAWITMVHDFWRYRSDDAFVRQFLPGIQQVLDWYERQKTPDGLIPPLFHLDFVDSSYGRQRRDIVQKEGQPGMAPHSLFYAMALNDAADLFAAFGREFEAERCRREASEVKDAVRRLCWDSRRQLFADTPSKQFFSQQANILAVLADALPQAEQAALLNRTLADPSVLRIQMYFRYYLGRALAKAGRGDRYIDNLGPWERMIANGMTTFGESDGNPRSECHPWSATPVYEFLTTVAGIEPASPGFKSVRIAPALGSLKHVQAAMPHPLGMIEVELTRQGDSGLKASVHLPPGLKGTFVWRGRSVPIEGARELSF